MNMVTFSQSAEWKFFLVKKKGLSTIFLMLMKNNLIFPAIDKRIFKSYWMISN